MNHESLPPIPANWVWTKLGEIAEVKLGKMLSPKAFESGLEQFPYLRNENVRWFSIDTSDVKPMGFTAEEKEKFSLREGDLLVCEGGEPGRCAVVTPATEHFMFQKALHRVRPIGGVIDSRLLQYCFKHFIESGTVIERRSETTIQHLPREKMIRVPLPLPPAGEQLRIVERIEEIFSDLDAGVAALERVKANLKRYRASVLKAAVEGRLTEEWRAKNRPKETGEQLLKRILHERRRKWEEEQLAAFAAAGKEPPKNWRSRYKEPLAPETSTLPIIPSGWCWATVEQVGIVQLGRQRAPQHHNGPHMRPYLRVANVFEDRIDVSDVMQMNFTPREFETYRLASGDILLNEGQSMELVGRPAMYRDEVPGACFTNTLVRFRACGGLDPNYALKVFLAYLKNGRFQKIATITVNIAHLGAGRFAEIEVPLPPTAEQVAIVAEVDRHFSLIDDAQTLVEHSLARAARLRQSILTRAFEGKLVAQDPADEPAALLLARIEQSRAAAGAMRTKAKPHSDEFLRRAAIVSYTIKRLAPQPSFGRTQLEKTLHLAQSHLGIDLGLEFERYAAGPFNKSIYRLEGTANKSGWFAKKNRRRVGVTYHPGPKIDAMCQHAVRLLGDKQAAFDRLLDHIATMNTDEAELFSTAYAACNDLLIDGRNADDGAIIKEIYGWDASKKKFTRAAILKRLEWMRRNNYVPTGRGHRTMPMKKSAARREPRGK